MKVGSQSRAQCGANAVHARHFNRNVRLASALNKGPQLILDVLRRLPREPWNGIKSAVTSRRCSVAVLTIFDFALEAVVEHATRPDVSRMNGGRENDCRDGNRQNEQCKISIGTH